MAEKNQKTINGIPVYNVFVDEEDIEQGVDMISLVDEPAIMVGFRAFGKSHKTKITKKEIQSEFAKIDEQRLAGPFLIPDLHIPRFEEEMGGEYYVVFTKEEIAKIARRWSKHGLNSNFNIHHGDSVSNVYVEETWIIKDRENDNSKRYGFNLPEGTWFGVVHVEDSNFWNEKVKTGEVRGFSVELFSGLELNKQIAEDNREVLSEKEQNKALDQLAQVGKSVPKNWKRVKETDVTDGEHEDLSADQALKGFEFAINANPDEDSYLDREKPDGSGMWRVRYEYSGPRDGRNRQFCARLLDYQNANNVVFRREDINQMSFRGENGEFGRYSIFKYKGSYGCRHRWRRVVFFEDYADDETRQVGNVPAVGGKDPQATSKNPEPQRSKQSKIDNSMSEKKQDFAKLEDLPAEGKVVGADVDNEDGTYEMDGVTYVVQGGKITEVVPAEDSEDMGEEGKQKDDAKLQEDGEGTPDVGALMERIDGLENVVGELAAKVESMQGGSEETSEEELSKVKEKLSKVVELVESITTTEHKKDTDVQTSKLNEKYQEKSKKFARVQTVLKSLKEE